MQTFLQDLRYGLRMIQRNPGFTMIAVLSLALGIGANTAIFSLINAVLLKPLSFHNPDELVLVWEDTSERGSQYGDLAPANYADWQAQNQVFGEMAALEPRSFNLTLGRAFTPDDDKPDANNVVIISHHLWQSHFAGDHDILNNRLQLNDQTYQVIGVMPAEFQLFQAATDLWLPIKFTAQQLANRGGHYLTVIARMKSQVNIEQTQADLNAISQRIAEADPANAAGLKAVVVPLHEQLVRNVRRPFLILLGAAGFVLLIACANVASLLLSRASSRGRELAIRSALGAGRFTIVRQLLTESLLLAGLAGLAGIFVASWSFELLGQLIPAGFRLTTKLTIDPQMLGYTLLISIVTAVVFGLVPALQGSKADVNEALKQSGGRSNVSATHRTLRNSMVISEIALALVLLVGAGLLMQTFYKLRNQYSEIHPENVLTARTELLTQKYTDFVRRDTFYNDVLERVKSLPGVISAGYTTSVPLAWKGGASDLSIEGRLPEPGVLYNANHRQVSNTYLETIGLQLKDGRYFNAHDTAQSQPVVIINETLARGSFPNENPIGKRLKVGSLDSLNPWMTVVGVVADVRQMGLEVPVKAEIYLPYQQINYRPWFAPRDLVIRTSVEPLSLVASVRQAVQAVDPEQPLSNIRTLDEILVAETNQRRLGMALVAAFAGLALLLAGIGIYGVLAYFVVQHTPEIGVRIALGAQQQDILALIMKRGLGLAFAGVGIGLFTSLALTRLIESLLFGVTPTDAMTFVGVSLLLAGVALVACLVPARRAMKVDPIVALRYE
jgi:putative ABC transport system permease protein